LQRRIGEKNNKEFNQINKSLVKKTNLENS